MFCYEHYGVEPDIMTLGKGIGGGFPLSALLTKERLNIFDPGDQGGTYTAQPLAMAVGLCVLKELVDKKLVENSEKMGGLILSKLHALENSHCIENVRGKGLLIAFDLKDQKGCEFVEKCLENNLLVNSPGERTIRLMPPLIVSEQDIDKLISILKILIKKG